MIEEVSAESFCRQPRRAFHAGERRHSTRASNGPASLEVEHIPLPHFVATSSRNVGNPLLLRHAQSGERALCTVHLIGQFG
jgi:hypothetical protein